MAPLKVEYSKSSRARCSLKECGKLIEKGEVRIGTGSMMPGVDELSYKWRHLCCFTKRQLASVASVDNIEGYDDLADEDQVLIRRMIKGELVGDSKVLGRVAPSQAHLLAAAAGKTTKKKKKVATAVSGAPSAAPSTGAVGGDEGDVSDATDDFGDLVASATAAGPKRTKCEFGAKCFRKNPEHFKTHSHPGDTDYSAPAVGGGGGTPCAGSDALAAKKPKVEAPAKLQQTLSQMWRKPGDGTLAAASAPAVGPAPSEAAAPPAVKYDTLGRKICPFGAMCFRTAKEHHDEWAH